jgi:hypothetical protein
MERKQGLGKKKTIKRKWEMKDRGMAEQSSNILNVLKLIFLNGFLGILYFSEAGRNSRTSFLFSLFKCFLHLEILHLFFSNILFLSIIN